jgi:CubicO group peptidase (beta-lactamase class C family)
VEFGAGTRRSTASLPDAGCRFGFGVAVRVSAGQMAGSVGEYFWGGGTGPCFWVDPREGLVAVLMITAPGEHRRYRLLARRFVYAALANPSRRRWR